MGVIRPRLVPLGIESVVPVDVYPVPIRCAFAQWRIHSVSIGATIDGYNIQDIWSGTSAGAGITVDFPPFYDPKRRLIPYDQVFRIRPETTAALGGGVTCFDYDGPMSTTHRIRVRFMPTVSRGAEPVNYPIKAHAVAVRMGSIDPLSALVDGTLILSMWSNEGGGGVALDWPPVYDAQFNAIPYDTVIRLNSQGNDLVGGFTLFDIVPV